MVPQRLFWNSKLCLKDFCLLGCLIVIEMPLTLSENVMQLMVVQQNKACLVLFRYHFATWITVIRSNIVIGMERLVPFVSQNDSLIRKSWWKGSSSWSLCDRYDILSSSMFEIYTPRCLWASWTSESQTSILCYDSKQKSTCLWFASTVTLVESFTIWPLLLRMLIQYEYTIHFVRTLDKQYKLVKQ